MDHEESKHSSTPPPLLDKTDYFEKRPTVVQGGILFSIFVILFISSGLILQIYVKEKYSGVAIILNQVLLVALLPIAYLKYLQVDVFTTLRLHKISFKNILLIVSMIVSISPLVLLINFLSHFLIQFIYGQTLPQNIPIPENYRELVISLFVISITAGICEEILFRGFLLRSLESLGIQKALLISGLCFALIHLDIQKIPSILVLGILIGYIVYRTNSLWAGIVAHMVNNAIYIVFLFLANQINPESKTPPPSTMPSDEFAYITGMIVALVFFLFFILLNLMIFQKCLSSFIKKTEGLQQPSEKLPLHNTNFVLFAYLPAILAIMIILGNQIQQLYNPKNSILNKLFSFLSF